MGEQVSKPARRALRYQLKYRGNECLNCGHPLELSDRFCPYCSQLNSTKSLTMRDFIDEFLGSIIDYDSRLIKTVKALLFRPGRISLDYVAGKRVYYTNPFRFLLSLAIIYFLLLKMGGDFRKLDEQQLDRQLGGEGQIPSVPLNLELDTGDPHEQEVLRALDSLKFGEQLARAQHVKDSTLMANPKGFLDSIQGSWFGRVAEKTSAFITLVQNDTLRGYQQAVDRYGLTPNDEDRLSFDTAQSLLRLWRQPGSFISAQMSKLPLATFFFLPVFSIFLWLVYIRKKYTYTDNLVFSFHIQSLFFILLIIGFLAGRPFGKDLTWLSITVFSVYLYAALRKFYKQGHLKTIIKYLFLNTVFVILAWLAVLALFVGSAVTY